MKKELLKLLLIELYLKIRFYKSENKGKHE